MLRLDVTSGGAYNTPDIYADLQQLMSKDRRRFVVALGRLLKGPRSLWRDGEGVGAGRSRRAFFVQQQAGGTVVILNRAKNLRTGVAIRPHS